MCVYVVYISLYIYICVKRKNVFITTSFWSLTFPKCTQIWIGAHTWSFYWNRVWTKNIQTKINGSESVFGTSIVPMLFKNGDECLQCNILSRFMIRYTPFIYNLANFSYSNTHWSIQVLQLTAINCRRSVHKPIDVTKCHFGETQENAMS